MFICLNFSYILFSSIFRVHSDVAQRVKKKVTLRHSLDEEPPDSNILNESLQESPADSSREGLCGKDSESESPARSIAPSSPVLTTAEQHTSGTALQDSICVDVPEDDETQTELPLADKPAVTSETDCDLNLEEVEIE